MAASSSLLSLSERMCSARSHSGGLWVPTTLSRMIFSGHGPASVMTVWTSMAAKTIASWPE